MVNKENLESKVTPLDNEKLEQTSGGDDPEESFLVGFCTKCSEMITVKQFAGGRYACRKCGTRVTEVMTVK